MKRIQAEKNGKQTLKTDGRRSAVTQPKKDVVVGHDYVEFRGEFAKRVQRCCENAGITIEEMLEAAVEAQARKLSKSNGQVDCILEAGDNLHDLLKREIANVIVEGDSMKPYLIPGDQIQCNHDLPKNGQLAVAQLKDGRVFVARYERHSNDIKLRFENPTYGPLTLHPRELAFVAKVHTILRDETAEVEGGAR